MNSPADRLHAFLLAAAVCLLPPSLLAQAAPLATFPATNVGSTSLPQAVTFTLPAAATISSIAPAASLGNKNEYTAGTVTGCVVDGATSNPIGTICSIPITFTPAYPGLRAIPLQAVTSAGKFNFGLNAIGLGPLAALTPGIISIYAGLPYDTNRSSGDGGPATSAQLTLPTGIAIDSAGDTYVSDLAYSVVRRIDGVTGVITTVAGMAASPNGFSGDGGPATSAQLNHAEGLALDSAGNLYIADTENSRIRRVTAATGIISTVVGDGTSATAGDGGLGTSAEIHAPYGVAIDSAGNLYIAELGASVIRRVDASTGIITTIAGIAGVPGYAGDGGPATSANLEALYSIAFDSGDNLYLTDGTHGVIRKITATTGIITTVVGNGSNASTVDGVLATETAFHQIRGVAVDSAGDIYFTCGTVVDLDISKVIRKVSANTGIVTTVVGGDGVDRDPPSGMGGPATAAGIGSLPNLVVDSAGNLYFPTDSNILKVDVSTSALTYPQTTPVGTPDAVDDPQTAILNNIGNEPLTGSSGNGAITSSWLIDASSTCFPFTSLASGNSCTLPVDFKPTLSGALTGTLPLEDNSLNASPATQSITLTGTATGGTVTIAPALQAFPATAVGNTSAAQSSTLTNGTASAITLHSGSLTDATDFTQSDNCNGQVAAGGSCTVTFTFTPQSAGALSSSYSIATGSQGWTVALSGTGTAALTPQASLSPTSLSFTTVVNTVASNQTVTLTNSGTADLIINSLVITGTNASSFTIVSESCGPTKPDHATLAAGASCQIVIGFPTIVAGTYTANLTVTDDASATIQTVALNGTVTGTSQAVFSPASLSFATVVNTAAPNQTVTLSNPGTAPLAISSVALGGVNASSFNVVSNACGATLAAGANCIMTIGFPVTVAGTYNATLTANDNAIPATQTVALSGTVTGTPQAALSPATLSFTTSAGVPSTTATSTLSNAGTAALTIASINLSGSGASTFSQTNTCGTTLAPAAYCTISVVFSPSAAGSYSANLVVTDNAATTTQTATLTRTATSSAAPQPPLSPANPSFGSVATGLTSTAQTFTLANAGTASLAITSISIGGANAASFAITSNACGAALAAGASCTLTIAFSPTSAGNLAATLSVVDAVGTQTSALSGVGVSTTPPDFSITATPAAQSTYRGASVSYTIQLASLLAGNPFNSAVTLSAGGLPAGAMAKFSPAMVTPGTVQQTSTLTVEVPGLVSRVVPGATRPGESEGITPAMLALGLLLVRRARRRMFRVLSVLLLAGIAGLSFTIMGCGTGNGFKIPTSTSTIIVTATGGSTTHSTTVTLTIQ